MNLDDLAAKWLEHDRKLDANLRLSRRLLTATHLNGARSALQRLTVVLALEVVATLAGILALGAFIYEHSAVARFALPAAVLDVIAIAMLGSLIRQIAAIVQVDYGQPITAIQKRLEALQMMRARYVLSTVVAGIVGWVLIPIVAMKGFFGLDVYRIFNGAWLVANLLFGLGVVVVAVWLSRTYGHRMDRYPVLQHLMKNLAGHKLGAAAGFLATLSEFEKDSVD